MVANLLNALYVRNLHTTIGGMHVVGCAKIVPEGFIGNGHMNMAGG